MSKASYYKSLIRYERITTSKIRIGDLFLGGDAPVRLQSMTNTNTRDTEGSVEQSRKIIDAGGELVRLTAQGVKEAENLRFIKESLVESGYKQPVVADIHFNPRAAFEAALHVDKVRINPGNFTHPAKRFDETEYSDEEYKMELNKIEESLIPFLDICKDNNTAIRIGVNHGSLSDRIMSRYGDTAKGMVESCMEYLRIAVNENFKNIVISIKSSNTRVMVHTVRLLIVCMKDEGMSFPLHLGVTEAGEGEDGRIKSAVGIGALLNDGIGDTIRVSLSEEPEVEIPVAKMLLGHVLKGKGAQDAAVFSSKAYQPFEYIKDRSRSVLNIGGDNLPVVISRNFFTLDLNVPQADWFVSDEKLFNAVDGQQSRISTKAEDLSDFLMLDTDQISSLTGDNPDLSNKVIILKTSHWNKMMHLRSGVFRIREMGITSPIIFKADYNTSDLQYFQLAAAVDLGGLFLDGLGDGIWLENLNLDEALVAKTSFGILQAARSRMTKTEFISCPGCGRTLFQLKPTIDKIKAATSHLKGLKVGIMGCIVNGPGEMADADYGYVGAGKGKINLYKNKECVERNISEDEAVERLIELIKREGDWKEPDESE